MTPWKLEELNDIPVQLSSDGTAEGLIQRRNIKKIEATDDTPEHYICEMRFITRSEYEMLNSIQNIFEGKKEV